MRRSTKIIRCVFFYPLYLFSYYLPSPYLPKVGKICSRIRNWILYFINPEISKKITVGKRCYFGNLYCLRCGPNVSFGNGFEMHNVKLTVGENVMIASDVMIMGGGHRFTRTDIPMTEQGELGKTELIIEDDVWIGTRVTILAKNIVIGKGSIIGANAVVTKNIPPYSIVVGNPAKVVKTRDFN